MISGSRGNRGSAGFPNAPNYHQDKIYDLRQRSSCTMAPRPNHVITISSKYEDRPSATRVECKTKAMSLFSKELSYDEIYAISRAILLALSTFYWCYYSLRYGPKEFTILENELVLPGFVFSKKAVITFSYGYSTWNSVVSASAAVMVVYSVISRQPLFSLPVMLFFLTEIVYDFCNVVMMVWVIFVNLQLQSALFYAVKLLLMILAELWMWLGVVQLYEYRTFEL